ncbi:hypothetical protein [Neptuniibacter sp.]|uniref:hypothetical protein n=1 Tax=Neptuniibacter sp. TaxID=1962643 RepID=UPI0026334212|nr:hypothetical protein [Neptuniibacter sp.]MCP4596757.1 hypothetical protein [Neptuniibacter sp.]
MHFAFSSLLAFLLLFADLVKAVEVVESNAKHSNLIEQLVENRIAPILDQLPLDDQVALDGVRIKVVNDLRTSGMAIALDGIIPRVIISNSFIDGLDAYVESYLVADFSNQLDFPERYFHHYFWYHHPDFDGPSPLAPLQMFKLNSDQKQTLLNKKKRVLESVLLDVVLHELGHHAKDAFYSYRASYFTKQDNERLADRWADQVKAEYFEDVEPLGRLISIAFIFERDRWSTLSDDGNYPRLLSWVIDSARPICEDTEFAHVQSFCTRLGDNINIYFSSKAEQAYRQRRDKGDSFASFPLAQILLSKNNFVDACTYFNESLIEGQVARAAVYVAWCYQQGYLDPTPPDAQVLAFAKYRAALGYGYSDAGQYIQSLNNNYGIH